MEEFKNKIKRLIAKLKTIKNIEIIIGIVIICIVALIYSTVTVNKGKTPKAETVKETESSGITAEIEKKLEEILSEIKGAGKVKVMITYETTAELVTAGTVNTHTNSSAGGATKTETITPIIVNNNGKSELIILKEIMPEIEGVIIVAEGASDIRVRMELMRAARAVLDIDANAIEIFAMK